MTTQTRTTPKTAARMAVAQPSAIGSALRLGDRSDLISLAGGLPAPETFPAAVVASRLEALAHEPGRLQYGDTDGLPELREWISAYLRGQGADAVPAGRIVTTHGSQQGIDLVCKVMLDPGDVVLVDRPSYVGALQVFGLFQAHVRDAPIADDSDLSVLTELLAAGLRPKIVYVVSRFSNPAGTSLTSHQWRLLAGLADEFGFLIVDDDPYRELWLTDSPPKEPSVMGLSDHVVQLGSFSKMLFPGARLGYLAAPAWLAPHVVTVKQAADLGNSALVERLVLDLLEMDGLIEAQLAAARKLYRERRDALASALDEQFRSHLRVRVPDGGFFIWAGLPPGVDAARLLDHSLVEGVSFVPGKSFYISAPDPTTLRLSYAALPADCAEEAARRLSRGYRRLVTTR